jgi:hypothetical protein
MYKGREKERKRKRYGCGFSSYDLSCSFKVGAEDKCAGINSFLKSHQHFPQLHRGRK